MGQVREQSVFDKKMGAANIKENYGEDACLLDNVVCL